MKRIFLWISVSVAIVAALAVFVVDSQKEVTQIEETVQSKSDTKESPQIGSGRGDLKRKQSQVDLSSKSNGSATADQKTVEEKSIIIGSVDPLERGSKRDEAGNYIAKTRDSYQPSKKIPRHALSTYIPVQYAEDNQPQFQGDPVLAYVNLPTRKAGKHGRLELTPNDNGEFPRIFVEVGEEVEVRLIYPKADKNAKYAVSAQDGGLLDDGFPTGLVEQGKNQEMAFRFAPSENIGTHRVVVRSSDGNVNVLDFWVGPDHTFAQPSADTSSRDAAIQRMQARRTAKTQE